MVPTDVTGQSSNARSQDANGGAGGLLVASDIDPNQTVTEAEINLVLAFLGDTIAHLLEPPSTVCPASNTPPHRVALYVRVSTTRQAEGELSIPDQIKQGQDFCVARGLKLIETFIEPGASATDHRRPEFQRMMDAASSPARPFDMVVVHSMSRFFREQFLSEMYIRKLRKAGVTLVSMTQEFQNDPTET